MDNDSSPLSVNLKHNEALVIRGLYPKATITYTETNNTTGTYKVQADYLKDNTPDQTEDDISFFAERSVTSLSTTAMDTFSVSNYATQNSATNVSNTVTSNPMRFCQFTNRLDAVSPTGIILRFIPFIILAGFAGALFMLAGKTRDKSKGTRKI